MHRATLHLAILAFLAGCAADSARDGSAPGAQPGSFVADGSPFYAEELVKNEKMGSYRLFVFAKKATHEEFRVSKDMDPKRMQMHIGAGPVIEGAKRATLVLEQSTDADENKAVQKRLKKTLQARYGASSITY